MAGVDGFNSETETPKAEAREPEVGPSSPGDQEQSRGTADQAPKQPKRKYNISDKVRASSPANLKQARKKFVFTEARRAAAMKNLEKANAAPPEKRHRLTERRLLARYANLCLAHLKLGPPGQRSPSHIYTGTSCRHLEHSLALAGEDKAKLEAHRDRFQRTFRPRDREESRFVRGMADATWRLLRGLGVRYRWEKRAVQFRLMLAINWRQAGKKLEPGDAGEMAEQLLRDLGTGLYALYEEQKRLRKRLEQLFRAFLSHRMGGPSSFHWFTGEGSRLPDFEHMPDFALSNPYLWLKEAQKLAEQEAAGPKPLKEAKDWAGQPPEGKDASPSVPISSGERDRKFLYHQMLQAKGFHDGLDQAGLEQMLELACGIDGGGLETGNSKIETREDGPRSPVADGPGDKAGNGQRETESGRRVSSSPSSMAEVAATLWARLVLFRDWRDGNAREIDETLEQASGPQGVESWEPQPPRGRVPKSGWPRQADDQSPHWQWRALAALLLAVFACDIEWLDQASVLAWGLQGALYRFLVWHYQDRAGFDSPEREPERWLPPYWQPGQWGHYLRGQYAHGVKAAVVRRL